MSKETIIKNAEDDLDVKKIYHFYNKENKINYYICEVDNFFINDENTTIDFFSFKQNEYVADIKIGNFSKIVLPSCVGNWSDYKQIYSRFESKFNKPNNIINKINLLNKTIKKDDVMSFELKNLYNSYLEYKRMKTGKSYNDIEKQLEKDMEKKYNV